MIVGTAAIELSIPVLLLVRRTRHLGVVRRRSSSTRCSPSTAPTSSSTSRRCWPALFVLFLPAGGGHVGGGAGRVGPRPPRAASTSGCPSGVHARPGRRARWPVGLLVAVDAGRRRRPRSTVGWWPWQLYAVACVVATAALPAPATARRRRAARSSPHHMLFAARAAPRGRQRAHAVPRAEDRLRLEHVRQPPHGRRRLEPLPRPRHLPAHRRAGRPRADRRTRRSRPLGPLRATTATRLTGAAAHLPRPSTRTCGSPTARGSAAGGRCAHASDDPELVEPVPAWREKLLLFRAVDLRVAGALRAHVRARTLTGPVRVRR